MIASLVRIFGFALLLAALANARSAPSPQVSVPVANNVATAKSFIRLIYVKNEVSDCTAFLSGEGCGSEIQLGPFETIDKPATCFLSLAAIKCGSLINCSIGDLSTPAWGENFTVIGLAGDTCKLIRSEK